MTPGPCRNSLSCSLWGNGPTNPCEAGRAVGAGPVTPGAERRVGCAGGPAWSSARTPTFTLSDRQSARSERHLACGAIR